ncbi:MAG: transposase [Chloroflexi bacterium]|nr:transposase [Chloroflexota bacterium]
MGNRGDWRRKSTVWGKMFAELQTALDVERNKERCRGSFEKTHYRKRNIIERLINRLKQFRRIATRYEKRAANFSAMITIAPLFLFSDFAYRL